MRVVARSVVAAGVVALAAAGWAQAPGIRRVLLQRVDVEGPEQKECILGTAEVAPGGASGRHFHHGTEVGYVVEGQAELAVDGESPRRLGPGDSFRIEARRPHEARNVGPTPLRVVSAWVVEKGKPLAEPAR